MLRSISSRRRRGGLQLVDGPSGESDADGKRCAYCVPEERVADRVSGDADCLIKMLGARERRAVSLTLHRIGRDEGLFGKQCPMANDSSFDRCPFYEDESEVGDD